MHSGGVATTQHEEETGAYVATTQHDDVPMETHDYMATSQHDIPDLEDLGALTDVLEGVEPLTDPFPGGPIDVSLLRCFRTHIVAHIWVSEGDIRPHKVYSYGE
ncbi:hypothetical protein Dimus_011114, partial [Dionaea muscipula]